MAWRVVISSSSWEAGFWRGERRQKAPRLPVDDWTNRPRRPQISFRVRARVARGSGIGQVPASGCERMCRGTVTVPSARTHLSAFDARSTCSRRLAVAVACRVFARTCVQGALSACR